MTRHRLPDRPHTKPTVSLVLELCAHVMAYKLDAEMLKCTCFSLVPANRCDANCRQHVCCTSAVR